MTQTSFQIISSAVTDRGLSEKRPQNEDSYLEMPEYGLFSVADGVGGAQAGDVASQMAMEMLGEAFRNLREGGDVEELMEIAISRANGSIFQMSTELPQLSTMATTIVTLHVTDSIATIGHVGDSRLYRLDSRGNLYRETQDHSVVEEEVRAGRMTPEQAEHHPSKNVISRALGAESTVEIDMKTIMFEPNTTFLLCSDGITRHIPDAEIRNLLAQSIPPVEICQQMREICYSRGAEDNLTAVIVRILGNAVADDSDVEENTVATARQPLVNTAIFSNAAPTEEHEIPTQNLQLPAEYDQTRQLDEPNQISIPATSQSIDASSVDSATSMVHETIDSKYKPETNYDVVEEKSGSGIGKFLTALACLIIGGLLGAGGVYYWSTTQQKVPQDPPPQSPNIPYTAFENNRRGVDKDAAQYIKTAEAVATSATADAEDLYLIGRAYLLTGKFAEAKNSFLEAKKRLSQSNTDDKKMLANEIALGLAAIENPKVLETERGTATAPNANSAANSNVAGNAKTVN